MRLTAQAYEGSRRRPPGKDDIIFMGTNTLGEIIYNLRKKAGLTQEALADGICSPISISRIENGNQMPSSKVLEKILERLGTGTYQLCNVYYENEQQASLRRSLDEISAQVASGDFASAKTALQELSAKKMDPASLQYTKMLFAAIHMKEGAAGDTIETELEQALRLTKPGIDLSDCRRELFSPTEANLLVILAEAKYAAGKTIEAIRLSEEVLFALDRNQSRLSEFNVSHINLAHNLSQYLLSENRCEEALLYARKAEELSIRGTEQFMLPEIEFGIAQILDSLGKSEESRARMEALIPYMRLIGKSRMADLAREYLDHANLPLNEDAEWREKEHRESLIYIFN